MRDGLAVKHKCAQAQGRPYPMVLLQHLGQIPGNVDDGANRVIKRCYQQKVVKLTSAPTKTELSHCLLDRLDGQRIERCP
jgi:hypothetical protein